MIEIKLPNLGENISSGTVVKVLVHAGDTVLKEQGLIELETEKATVEVPAPEAGTIGEVRVNDGDEIKVGQVIVTLSEGSIEGQGAGVKGQEKETSDQEEKNEMPEEQTQNQEEKQENSGQKKDENQEARVQTQEQETGDNPDPAEGQKEKEPTQEENVILSESEGSLKDTQQASRPVESTSSKINDPSSQPSNQPTSQPASRPTSQRDNVQTSEADIPASPSVRRLAREIGVDLSQVTGTGEHGRISEEDIKTFAKQILTGQQALASALPPLPDFSAWGEINRVPMSTIRKKTAEHLALSWATIPHVTQFEKIDITKLETLRKKHSNKERKLTLTPFILKVVAAALKHFPQFNASLDMSSQEIIHKDYYHIGFAVDTDHGLFVPVIRDADKKSILSLAAEMTTLAQHARDKKLTLKDMRGGTFTITNLGGIGGTHFTPIINYPEVAILGMGRARLETNYQEKETMCSPVLMLPLSLSYDHRIIDGADAARFLRWIADAIEQPLLMELE